MKNLNKLMALFPVIAVLSMLPGMTSHAETFTRPGSYQPGEANVLEAVYSSDETGVAEYSSYTLTGYTSSNTSVSMEQSTNDYGNVYTFKVSVAADETADVMTLTVKDAWDYPMVAEIEKFDKYLYPKEEHYTPGESMDFFINVRDRFEFVDVFLLGNNSGTTISDLGNNGNQRHDIRVDFGLDEDNENILVCLQMYDPLKRVYYTFSTYVYKETATPGPETPTPGPAAAATSGNSQSATDVQPPESGYIKFLADTLEQIEKISLAGTDDAITIETGDWVSFPRLVYEKLQEKNKSAAITINYKYKGIDYTVTIPAGSDLLSLLDENGYCGFRYLDQIFGGSERKTQP